MSFMPNQPYTLTRDEQIDLSLLRVVTHLEDLKSRLVETDFGRVPSLRDLIQAAERVTEEIGYASDDKPGPAR
jgi:hypothetical protein